MTYLPTMGSIDSSKFVTRSGICKPTDFPTLYIFQELQYQLSRLAQGMKLAKIAPDGDIGPATIKLVNATGLWPTTSDCTKIASNADAILAEAKQKATALGVPEKITVPATFTKPSIVAPSGEIVVAPPAPPMGAGASVIDTVKSLGTTTMLALGAAVIGVGYFLTRPTKSTKSAKPRTRYRTRTRTRYIRRYHPRSRRPRSRR